MEKNEKPNLKDLKGFGEIGKILEKFLPRGFYMEDGMMMDSSRIIALFPWQELPESFKRIYKKRLEYGYDFLKKILNIGKKGEYFTFHFPKKDFPLLIETNRFIAMIAPRVLEDMTWEDDDENEG